MTTQAYDAIASAPSISVATHPARTFDSRRLLNETQTCIMVGGAFDGLSARLVESAGFDAVWASGFGISAAKALPDLNVLSITELAASVAEIVGATSLPVIVDCDEGYGSLLTTLRLVGQIADRGARGVCIEDNLYPKINSFCEDINSPLLSAREFRKKITAIRRQSGTLAILARTESLISGETMDAAITRALMCVDGGADYVLMHSKFRCLDEYREMTDRWGLESTRIPLVVIPTLATTLRFESLASLGFAMVIYANQAIRASIFAMQCALETLRLSGDPSSIDSKLVSMNEVFDLTGLTAAVRASDLERNDV